MNNIIPIILYAMTSISVFIPSIPHYFGDSIFILLALILGITLVFKLTQTDGRKRTKSILDLPILILLLFATGSLTYSVNVHNSLLIYFKLASLGIIFFSIGLIENRRKFFEIWILIVILGCSILSIYGIYEFFFGSIRVRPYNPPLSFFPNHNHLAGYLVLGIVFSIGAFIFAKHKIWQKYLIIFSIILTSVTFILIKSRGGFIALIVGLAVLFYCRSRKAFRCFILFTLVAIIILIAIPNPLRTHLFLKGNIDRFAYGRIVMWSDTLSYIRDNFWIGTGIGTFREYYPAYKTLIEPGYSLLSLRYAHSEILHLMSEMGVAGLVIIIWIGVLLVRIIKRNAFLRRDWPFVGMFAICLSILIHSLVEFNLHTLAISTALVVSVSSLVTNVAPRVEEKRITPLKLRLTLRLISLLVSIILAFLVGRYYLAESRHKKGNRLLRTHKYHDAIKEHNRAIELNPLASKYHSDLYKTYVQLYQRDNSRSDIFLDKMSEALVSAIVLEPRNPFYHRNLARVLSIKGDYLMARSLYDSSVRLAPSTPDFQQEYLDFLKGNIRVKNIE